MTDTKPKTDTPAEPPAADRAVAVSHPHLHALLVEARKLADKHETLAAALAPFAEL